MRRPATRMTGGRLGLTVYGPIEHNPATFALARALDRHLGPDASVTKRAEHALADPALLRMLAAGAGFSRVQIVTETRIVRFASVADYARIQLTATPGPGKQNTRRYGRLALVWAMTFRNAGLNVEA